MLSIYYCNTLRTTHRTIHLVIDDLAIGHDPVQLEHLLPGEGHFRRHRQPSDDDVTSGLGVSLLLQQVLWVQGAWVHPCCQAPGVPAGLATPPGFGVDGARAGAFANVPGLIGSGRQFGSY